MSETWGFISKATGSQPRLTAEVFTETAVPREKSSPLG